MWKEERVLTLLRTPGDGPALLPHPPRPRRSPTGLAEPRGSSLGRAQSRARYQQVCLIELKLRNGFSATLGGQASACKHGAPGGTSL